MVLNKIIVENLSIRSKFGTQAAEATSNIRMEGNSDTVPSIVVYVTVPNREAGVLLFLFSFLLVVFL